MCQNAGREIVSDFDLYPIMKYLLRCKAPHNYLQSGCKLLLVLPADWLRVVCDL